MLFQNTFNIFTLHPKIYEFWVLLIPTNTQYFRLLHCSGHTFSWVSPACLPVERASCHALPVYRLLEDLLLSYRRLVHAGCRCPFKYLFCEHSFPLRTLFSLSLMMSSGRDLKFLMTASLLLNSSMVIVQVICLENSPLLWRFSVIFWRFMLLCL